MLIGEGDELLRDKINVLVEGGKNKMFSILLMSPMSTAPGLVRSFVATRP